MAETIDDILPGPERRAPDFLGTVADLLREPSGFLLFQSMRSEQPRQEPQLPVLPLYLPSADQNTAYTIGQ